MNVPRLLIRRRRRVALAWLLPAVVLLPALPTVGERLDAGTRIAGSESARVDDALKDRFDSPFAHPAILVMTGLPPVDLAPGRHRLRQAVETVEALPGIRATRSHLDGEDPAFVGADGGGTWVLAGLEVPERGADELVRSLRAETEALAQILREDHPRARLRWTGPDFLNHDLRRANSDDVRSSELRALPVTLGLLLLAFGTVAAALVPIGAGVLAIGLSLGLAALLAVHWPLSILLQSVVSILGLALGIDYALLMVGRFREARARGLDPESAGEEAARAAGRTVLLSGGAVAVGFAALLLVPIQELRSVAVGGLLVVGVAVLLATTLLPGLLTELGHRIDLGRVRRSPPGARPSELWRRWGRFVTRRPLLVLVAAGIPTLLMAAPVLRLSPSVPDPDWFPRGYEAFDALRDLRDMERRSVAEGARVLLELPPGIGALEPAGWEALVRLDRSLAADGRIQEVRSLPTVARRLGVPPAVLALPAADSLRRVFVSPDEDLVFLEAIPREGVLLEEMVDLVRELRSADPEMLLGDGTMRVRIGGLPAFHADYEDILAGRFGSVLLLVVGGTFVALLVGFRAVLVPIKALVLNVLSVGAAYGALVLVFQEGWGGGLFGVAEPLAGVFPATPILVFCTVFGLSMDYEVFLLSRIREARRSGLGENEAIVEGLARSGWLITSAAAIMVAVFGAFALGAFLPIQLVGFALAVAVLVDATVVRLAIGPALLTLAGRWNWWPGEARAGEGSSPAGGGPVAPGDPGSRPLPAAGGSA
jgi:putative drug exporter of the RND superfamily